MKVQTRGPDGRRGRIRLIRGRLRRRRKGGRGRLRRGVYLVPVIITSVGLLAGFFSIVSSINHHFVLAAGMIVVAFFCDGLDGRVARASRTASQFGVEYDSLADVVAFGVAPGSLAFTWAMTPIGRWGVVASGLFVLCAALRLARFNIQSGTVDKRRFVGLPVPGAAMMLAAAVFAYDYFKFDWPLALCAVVAPLTLALGGLMISRVPYPSFKGLDWKQKAKAPITAVILVCVAFVLVMPQLTAFLLAAAYVLSGPILMARGEQLSAKLPVLRAVGRDARSPQEDRAKMSPTESSPRRTGQGGRKTRGLRD